MLEEPHIEEAAKAQIRAPDPAMDRPTGSRQVIRSPAPSHFHDGDSVAFFRQTMSGNTTSKTRSDDDKIKIEFVIVTHAGCRSLADTTSVAGDAANRALMTSPMFRSAAEL